VPELIYETDVVGGAVDPARDVQVLVLAHSGVEDGDVGVEPLIAAVDPGSRALQPPDPSHTFRDELGRGATGPRARGSVLLGSVATVSSRFSDSTRESATRALTCCSVRVANPVVALV
jgi:hypothetical protein